MSTLADQSFSLAGVPCSDAPGVARVFAEVARVSEASLREVYGHTDLVDQPEVLHLHHLDRADQDRVLVVALAGPAAATVERDAVGMPVLADVPTAGLLGYGYANLPLHDNTSSAELHVEVHPDARGAGVGTAVLQAVEEHLRAAGREVTLTWTTHREETSADDPDALTAPTGVGNLRRSDPVVAFALSRGYRLEQTERHSQLDLPVPAAVLDPLREQAVAASAGYRLLTWVGATPPEHVEGMARLRQRMSVDVPMGELALEEERWDADRVRRADERAERVGRTQLYAVAQHEASGELVAYTLIMCPQDKPEVAWQGDTLVHGEHRGHRLGLLVKVANLDQLARVRPGSRRIHTWNAGENRWMLAINVALGFRRVATEGIWQRRFTDGS